MKLSSLKTKAVAWVIGGFALMTSGTASAIIVGGVDFGALGTTSHLETTTLAETLITGNGQELIGYGQVNTVNGNLFYAGAQRLYFTFEDYISTGFTGASVGFTGGTVNVFLGNTFNLLDQSSAANIALIQGLTPWATLSGHTVGGAPGVTLTANGSLTGETISFAGAGLLDVIAGLADVVAYLDVNNISDLTGGFADIALTTSGNNNVLNPFDNTVGCDTGQAAPGQFCIAGSADLRGTQNAVPEPATLALFSLGLLGIAASRRRRAS